MLPASDMTTVWPPAPMAAVFDRMRQWNALYSGDLDLMQAAFASAPAAPAGGLTGAVKRFFLGEAPKGDQKNTKIPIPIAAEICQASADLLFSDPITVTVTPDSEAAELQTLADATEARLAELLDDHFHAALAQSAELGAALGGSYLRATWSVDVYPDRPFTTVLDADNALPEFLFGRLRAVTFWWVVQKTEDRVWRHLERHELDSTGNGVIRHGLFEGNEDRLGVRVSLTAHDSTAALATHVDLNDEGTLDTKTPGLAVQYLPNQTPNRGWRTHATGRYLGRSDLDGIEHLIDQLAEVMSAWLRAIRLAKARLFIDRKLLTTNGPGGGLTADLEREAYVAVNGLQQTARSENGSGGGGSPIQLEQAQVEFEQYKATVEQLVSQILQMAGYSTQTFGEGSVAAAATATEIESRERRSMLTRDRKTREVKPGIGEHVAKLLHLDNTFFGGKNLTTGIDVVFPEGVQQSQIALARTVQALYVAESASRETRVAMLHPDWTDEQVAEEVDRIEDEFSTATGAGYPVEMRGSGPTDSTQDDETDADPDGDLPAG